jgi:hypothetical protein
VGKKKLAASLAYNKNRKIEKKTRTRSTARMPSTDRARIFFNLLVNITISLVSTFSKIY